jgi:plasmid stabilization system protein ParE
VPKRKVTWTKRASRQFNAAIKNIRKDSEQNADKVKERVLKKIGKLSTAIAVHRKDIYKRNNDGNYLYFEILKHRIVYYSQHNEVFIIRVRHTGKEPKPY